ncbi:ATP-binding cassette domain-containing protein [Hyunsoonleella pacifica]|uniref:ATP-binding cassette domain-containing protein n=1 Tax=Hyunsoonleella pacifica TaxID=1080224 RepID=A0A4Q9FPD9_9FLAO|nr:ATP-binding cassette domain-containing protein [Hyunsoonleella pacifica]TBN16569.1 ATP-binding cassette domain-containing protein [Hyunsoonleella pacifica]GGD18323.1 ABC transporter ATP-binding protein [Hyunsoonleella pacifica]
MLQTGNLIFHYKENESAFSFPDISLKIRENLLILGKSGIGKTTLLHLLAGLLTPVSGTITIGGVEINKLSHRRLDVFRGQNIGLVFQKKYAIQSLSVLKNLEARIFFSKKPSNNDEVNALLEELDLTEYKHKKLNKLSEGQLQRLNIAMAVIHKPQVILADEPTSSLDDENCSIVIELLKKQALQNNANLIVITHDSRIKPFFQNTITL